MFLVQILIANVLVPSAIAVGAILLSNGLTKRGNVDPNAGHKGDEAAAKANAAHDVFTEWFGAGAAFVAILLAFGMRNGFSVWSEDSWLRIPTAAGMVALSGLIPRSAPGAAVWLVRLLATVAAAFAVFPTGEAWEFLEPTKGWWIATMVVGTLVGWWAFDRRSPYNAGVLSLSWIACLVAAAFLSAQSFLKATEPLLAVASVLGCFGIAAIGVRAKLACEAAVGPSLFVMTACIANSQFNSFLGLSDWLSHFAMISPACAALVSLPLIRNKVGYEKTVTEVAAKPVDGTTSGRVWDTVVSVFVCLIFAAIVISWTVMVAGAGQEEW